METNPADLAEGLRFMEKEEYARAAVSFLSLAKKKGATFETSDLQGMCYFKMNDWRNAERSFSAAISYLESPDPRLYHYRGLARLYLGDFSSGAEDLILAIRYTPFETLNEKAALLGAAFCACVLAKDDRSAKIFEVGYSHCPLALVEEIEKVFVPYLSRLKMDADEKEAVRKRLEKMHRRAVIDQALFSRRAKKQKEELGGLIGSLEGMRIEKREDNS